MVKKFAERLKSCGLDDRTELMLSLDPGIMFGFPSGNLDKMMQRVDCPTCLEILVISKEMSAEILPLDEKIAEICNPTVERNKLLMKRHKQRQKIPFFGRFFKKPELEPMPDHYKDSDWYVSAMARADEMAKSIDLLRGKDKAHWGDEENFKISMEVVGRFVQKDHLVYVTGEAIPQKGG